MKPTAISRLRAKAARLEAANSMLVKRLAGPEVTNNLSGLVSGLAFAQDNLTSFLPMIQANIYAPLSINYNILTYMYKTHGILQTAVDMPVEDAFREELDFSSKQLDASDLQLLQEWLEEHAWEKFKDTRVWARLYGGAGMICNLPSDPERPFNLKEIKPGVPLEFYDASRWELGAPNKNSGYYEFYGNKIDASRVITMSGKRAPWTVRAQLQGWGMSVVERMVEDFNLFLRTRNVLYEILDEAKLDVFKLEGLRAQLASEAGTAATQQRIQRMNELKNFQRALVLDKEDEYEQKQLTFAGIAEVMKENRIGVASALRMPLSKIFGTTAGGGSMANSAQDDLENYNAMVESEERKPARPHIRKILDIAQLAVFGKVYDLTFKYKPLRVVDAKTQEEINASKQRRIEELYDRALMDSHEVGQEIRKQNLISVETQAEQGKLEPFPIPAQNPGLNDEQGDGEDGKGEKTDE